ncbi:DUF2793 domain-containing protein [Hyphomicrobium sp.]|jgi:hypothetical protein|uniref:DUF2793 domain-containing protein n=1 Tax=Hyphomicrobium sp. TaxID=82 RepID=UPI0035696CFB
MNDTPNLELPYILASQAQKHVTHNEAIRALDCLVQLSVESRSLTAPPASPVDGNRYLVAVAATGDWTSQSEKIAAFQDGAWAFYEPKEGWIAWVADDHELAVYSAGAWAAFSGGGTGGSGDITELDDLDHVGVNAAADSTNRLSLKSPASLFDNEGAGHQQKINKHAAADTASVLYQTNYSGRAEIGLAGDDDFHFKVSADGSAWHEAIKIDRASGRVDLPATNLLSPRNRVLNPMGQLAQAGLASAADGSYTGFDQWYALTQSGAITPSQLADVENGTPVMMRLTQAQATAQRFGIVQPFEKTAVRDLRGKAISVRFRARMSASTTLRWAVVEWTSTADSITKDIVNSWTNGTFTPGNFFLSSNLTVVGTGSLTLTANTLADCISNTIGTVSGSMNNLYLFIWTDSAQAQSVTLDIGNVWLGAGAAAPAVFDPPPPQSDLVNCQRYYAKTYPVSDAPGTVYGATGGGGPPGGFVWVTVNYAEVVDWLFPAAMRAIPSVSLYSPYTGASSKARVQNAGIDVAANTSAIGILHVYVQVNNVSVSANDIIYAHITADARL